MKLLMSIWCKIFGHDIFKRKICGTGCYEISCINCNWVAPDKLILNRCSYHRLYAPDNVIPLFKS